MLIYLFEWLSHYFKGLEVFSNYISVRIIMISITSLLITLALGRPMISWLQKMQIGQIVRDDGPQSHFSKRNTPTMGGVLILSSVIISCLLWGDLTSIYLWILILVVIFFGAIGFFDDYLKLVLKHPKGLRAKYKFALQSIFSIVLAIVLFYLLSKNGQMSLSIPFSKSLYIPMGIVIFVVLAFFIINGSSNAVNLTDGLDGLAIVPVVLVAAGLGIYAYIETNSTLANYLLFNYLGNPGLAEVAVFCAAVCGSGLAFLWFNSHPAEVFMGDVGSLTLGAVLGVIAVMVRQELIFFIMGLLFVVEALSVMLQVGSYKLRNGKRIFRMAPIHHHFELKGWPETKVVIRFWIISLILFLIGLAAIKVR
ncbi:phospho-N-acetylmuramoyl-pentapeptide-transferase [Francisella tularensis]|uniref:Phospho-N-acetylmuramoyl-pentapeptide-transferase n=1 Tax=Francisella tularensis subsp. tularensis (strain WY96-3418) TaxID=418136 RepID=MRAY_FRATW|nr:phospho-N-acetylmuramoyl-pentapeptide-transferase [Francisella tularensis]A4IZH0.1 RecName: Full=Phospho-N-acetylmuramoyl-pentapeptide-transferase; AltName: Full=UDP-MurNAc-pentapeptide phosphotransferase [Francisella tularensis subsp. tularensis WY96-3418]ABO47320.1 phospho-N-acetylmuramoyl-pentapeptide-transferase [Francisella tularensis subsp. tularensis WY96-3418]AJI63439.1 phospho-N-acetylmuramoyl-pentapeptide-transferase [Francisella tularensis subsp. tularensis]AKH92478.1 phospho-N-ac